MTDDVAMQHIQRAEHQRDKALERIAELEAKIAAMNRETGESLALVGKVVMQMEAERDEKLLALIRENGIGANSDDLEDAIRQVLQVAIISRDNYVELERKLAEERKGGEV